MKIKININIIYDQAIKRFAKKGYKKTTLDDIATKLNMTKGNLYLYTKNKKSLYDECVAYAMRKWQNKVKSSLAGVDSAKEQLYLLCTNSTSYLREDKHFCKILCHDGSIFPMFSDVDRYEDINNESQRMIQQIVENGIASGEFKAYESEKVAEILFSIYKLFIIETYIRTEDEYIPRLFDIMLQMLTEGLYK